MPLTAEAGSSGRKRINSKKFLIMEQLNRIELKGNVGNVKVQTFGENEVVRLSVATNYVYKGRDGNPVIETTWHNVTAWNGKGMPDFHKIEKGSCVYVSGRLRQQKFEGADGTEKQIFEVLANRLALIEDGPVQPAYGQ